MAARTRPLPWTVWASVVAVALTAACSDTTKKAAPEPPAVFDAVEMVCSTLPVTLAPDRDLTYMERTTFDHAGCEPVDAEARPPSGDVWVVAGGPDTVSMALGTPSGRRVVVVVTSGPGGCGVEGRRILAVTARERATLPNGFDLIAKSRSC